ncbi:ATP synthase F0 subunit B [Granulicella aggregans]|uniref:ATP synthase F0 subunit B n=1 Tax=Granulicella aggregans TaxID=474949 RepID=UPI0021E000DB|nr:ATP synthase F0 subunit B [Granulicella aggregans]
MKKLFFAVMFAALLASPLRSIRAQEPAAAKASAKPESEAARESKGVEEEEDETAAFKHSASVKKIGSMLGMSTDQAATAFEVANFAVLAILIGLFLAKALPKTFRGRNAKIQKDLVDARTATEEANSRLSGVEARLAKLDGEIAAMRAQADKDSAADEQRIKANVEEEKKKILASAEQEIATATAHAQRQIQKYAAELAIEQAAKKLVITAETDRLLIQNFARRVGADDSKEGQN